MNTPIKVKNINNIEIYAYLPFLNPQQIDGLAKGRRTYLVNSNSNFEVNQIFVSEPFNGSKGRNCLFYKVPRGQFWTFLDPLPHCYALYYRGPNTVATKSFTHSPLTIFTDERNSVSYFWHKTERLQMIDDYVTVKFV